MKDGQLTIISQKEARSVLNMQIAVETVEKVLKEHAQGCSRNPVKLHLPFRPEIEGYMNSMPAYMPKYDLMGAKLVTCHKYNPTEYGYPNTMGIIILERPKTGLPFAVVDGTYVTEIRTGAAAGVAAKYCAKKGAHVALQVGAGAQGTMAARAVLTAVPGVDEMRVADPNEANLAKFEKAMNEEFPNVKIVRFTDYLNAIKGAEIIAFATNAPKTLSREVKEFDKGTVVLMVAENVDDDDLRRFDVRVADFPKCYAVRINEELEAKFKATGAPYAVIREDTFTTTIGDLAAGQGVGRTSDDQTVVVGMCGMGIEDLSVAKIAYDRVVANGGGVVVDFQDI
jgi:alanine dehydrogenase